jgi:hypothetical protein
VKSPFSPVNNGINDNLNVLKRKEDAENDEKRRSKDRRGVRVLT